jgi:hypothetical protein
MAKFEIKIRISAKDYFDMTARYLPFELIAIEEFPDVQLPKAPPAVVAMANHMKRVSKVNFDSVAKVRKVRPKGVRIDLTRGMNLAIMTVLDDGKIHTTAEFIKALVMSGFKSTSINSLVARLTKFNHIARIKPGLWRKVERDVPNTQEAERITRAVGELDIEGIPEA